MGFAALPEEPHFHSITYTLTNGQVIVVDFDLSAFLTRLVLVKTHHRIGYEHCICPIHGGGRRGIER